ncbi:hypothetical protein ACYULU_07270 [Breznakiellaceae bacterium SP9]
MKTAIPCKITYSETDKYWYVEAPGFYRGIMTDGETLAEAKAMAAEAVAGLLETYLEHGDRFTIPKPDESNDWYDIEIDPSLAFALWLRNERVSRNMTLAKVADQMGLSIRFTKNLKTHERPTQP